MNRKKINTYGLLFFVSVFFCCLIVFTLSCDDKGKPPDKKGGMSKKISAPAKTPPAKTVSASTKEAPNGSLKNNAGADADSKTKDVEKSDKDITEDTTETAAVEEEIDDAYDPTGRIDPFAPLVKERKFVDVKETKKERSKHLTPLEKVDLSQLKLSAIILAPSGNRAVVTESDGKGYVVTRGTYIGLNSGTIKQILIDKIIVEEKVENILGKEIIRTNELKLQKPAGE